MQIRLAGAAGLRPGETRVFELPSGGGRQGFVLRHEEGFYAYLNQCRHWPVPLDLGDGDFLDPRIGRIVCKTHGAVYHPETGLCEFGPCARAVLEAFPVSRDGQDLLITVPDPG
jgi:nitrite reductase/ring-hydroxylating ferredoxin subunit